MRKVITHVFMAGAAAALAMSLGAQTPVGVDPEKAVQELNKLRADRSAEARQSGKPMDFAALDREVEAKAKEFCKGVDPAKVEPKKGFAWAQLFGMAGMHKESCEAAKVFLTSNPDPEQKFAAQILMLDACTELGEAAMIRQTLSEMAVGSQDQARILGMQTAYAYAETVAAREGPAAALAVLDAAEAKIPYDLFKSDKEKLAADNILLAFADARSEHLTALGKKQEALKALEDARTRVSPQNKNTLRRIDSKKVQLNLPGSAAPALVIERGHGEFKGLGAYRDKVVLIDFFAHWCGPCKAAFPDMKKMYADLHSKGFEILGVTTYYGYYKRENFENKDMPKDTEFDKMKEFIAEHGLPWPVVYGERSNFEAYGVSGIPHVVLIDKRGKVYSIKVGYSPESMAQLREKIEKLLAK